MIFPWKGFCFFSELAREQWMSITKYLISFYNGSTDIDRRICRSKIQWRKFCKLDPLVLLFIYFRPKLYFLNWIEFHKFKYSKVNCSFQIISSMLFCTCTHEISRRHRVTPPLNFLCLFVPAIFDPGFTGKLMEIFSLCPRRGTSPYALQVN